MAYPGRGVYILAQASNWSHCGFLEGQCGKGLSGLRSICTMPQGQGGHLWPPQRRDLCWSLAVSEWPALPRLVAGCMGNLCLPPNWAVLTHTDRLNWELEKQSGTQQIEETPARAFLASQRIWGSSPLNNLHQKVWKAQARVARDLQGWWDHKRPQGRRRSDLVWFPPFDNKEILILLWFKKKKKEKQKKNFWFKKKPLKG